MRLEYIKIILWGAGGFLTIGGLLSFYLSILLNVELIPLLLQTEGLLMFVYVLLVMLALRKEK